MLLVGASALWAHATLMESSPKGNSTVKGPDFPVTLRFNVRVDGSRSRLRLTAPDGSVSQLPIGKQASPDIRHPARRDACGPVTAAGGMYCFSCGLPTRVEIFPLPVF